MTIRENPELARVLLDRIKAVLRPRDPVTLPPVSYERDLSMLHRSDLLDCAMKPYLTRTCEDEPEISDRSALCFARGRMIERVLMADNDPMIRDDVIVTGDLYLPGYGPVEVKSTVSKAGGKPYPHWIEECRILGFAHETDTVHLAVVHLVGVNQRGRGGMDPMLLAYTMEYGPGETAEAWGRMMARKSIIDAALHSGEPPSWDEVRPTIGPWGCGDCQWATYCPYFGGQDHNGRTA